MALFDSSVNLASDNNAPIVVLISHSDNDDELQQLILDVYLQSHTVFSSIIRNNIDWNRYLSPWPCERIADM